MITPAELTSDPELIEQPGGHLVYTARADLSPSKRGIVAVMLPPVSGVALPYQRGDVVLVGLDGGTGYVLGHFASATEHEGHTMLTPRPDKDVRIGSGDTEWEPFMLYGTASLEIKRLKDMIDAVVQAATESVDPGVAAFGVAAAGLVEAEGWITGGEASRGAKGRTKHDTKVQG